MAKKLKHTKLYDWHVANEGRMVPFAGWEMPVRYKAGPKKEHHATRNNAGLFDIHHMAKFTVSGIYTKAYLNYITTRDVSSLKINEAHYNLMCYEDGGIVDDIFIYRLPDYWLVVTNASNHKKDFVWMQAHAATYDVILKDVSNETYLLALQGPKAIAILQNLTDISLSNLPRFGTMEGSVNGVQTIISRTGYTGEDGVELFFSPEHALTMWETLLQTGEPYGLEPIGLAARDSLRFEPAFSLYGHEIGPDITPLEARLGWAVNFNKNFIGKNALLKQKVEGITSKLIAFEMQSRSMPRKGYDVMYEGLFVGLVVTGLYAPTINKMVGHAFVPSYISKPGTALQIIIRNQEKDAVVVRRPLYKPAYRI